MARNWAICIGINNYNPRNFTPLKYARQDAERVSAFFQEMNFDKVYLFTDGSSPIPADQGPPYPSEPTHGNLVTFLSDRFARPFLSTGDNVWFFFAGHGERHNGKDYLMPKDANARGEKVISALQVDEIRDWLLQSGADNVILLLDACRSEGSRGGAGMAAKPPGVITLSSCNPSEKAWEINELGHGAFTYALLEALKLPGEKSCATVGRLSAYLERRVPALCQRYGKVPAQTPRISVDPLEKQHFILVPQFAWQEDIEKLKAEGFRFAFNQQLRLAEQMFIRANAAAQGKDLEIVTALAKVINRIENGDTFQSSESTDQPARGGATAETVSVVDVAQEDIQTPQAPPAQTPTSRSSSPPPVPPAHRVEPVGKSSSPPPISQPQTPATRPQNPAGSRSIPADAPPAVKRQQFTTFPSSTRERSPISRRRALQILGFVGGGIGVIWLGRSASPPPSDEAVREEILTREFETVSVNNTGEITARETKQANVLRQHIGDIFIDLVNIPGGSFTMGQTEAEKEELIRQVGEDTYQNWYTRELPRREVTVPGFLMGMVAVTQAQWRAVAALSKVERDLDADPSNFKGENRPVERVNWQDAVEFCQRLSQHTGREYRLPSEAEWEYACRAGTGTPFHVGETITDRVANFRATVTYGNAPEGEYRQETTDVGSFPANGFGLYDMHGNVWEWCADDWHENYEGAPTDGSAWLSSGSEKMVRGGSWSYDPMYCRSAFRFRIARENQYNDLGFRVVCASP
jgi:formylglycine-generating enzyme required for sulfatase activity/uncharacterized caspase-like protein